MSKIVPHRLSVVDFMKRKFADSEMTIEDIATAIGEPDIRTLQMILDGIVQLPATMIFPIAKATDIDPSQFMRIYLRDYLPDLERAMHDCEGRVVVTEHERSLLEAYRKCSGDTDPEILIFEEKRIVALALA